MELFVNVSIKFGSKPTRQKYRQEKASFGELGVDSPSNGPNRVPRGITPVLHTPSVYIHKKVEVMDV